MRKTKKKSGARGARAVVGGPRKFVKLTRAHLEMSGRLTDDEDKRYVLTALCVRRVGDAVVVEATNGHMAWQYPAELVDGGELPKAFTGEELADGERVLIDPATANQCLRALPKMRTPEAWQSAYLSVGADGVGRLFTFSTANFRLSHYDADAKWPDLDVMIPARGGPCVTLSAEMLCRIATWASKFLYDDGSEKPLTLSFFPHRGVVGARLDVDRAGGPVGALAPQLVHSGDMKASMPAWEAAFKKGDAGA